MNLRAQKITLKKEIMNNLLKTKMKIIVVNNN
jgi:hypothetical protein